MAHYTAPNGVTYVDTDFVNDSQRVPRVTLQHMGFGEFYADTPKGRVDFDRMRGKKFDGMKGRSHKLYGDGAEWLVSQMEQGGFSERTAAEADPNLHYVFRVEVSPREKLESVFRRVFPTGWTIVGVDGDVFEVASSTQWPNRARGAVTTPTNKTMTPKQLFQAQIAPAAAERMRSTGRVAGLPDDTLRLASQFEPDTAEHKALLAALIESGHDPRQADRMASVPTDPIRTQLIRLANSYPAGSQERKDVLAAVKSAGTLSVGDIMYSSWGYDQTNIDFYEVVAATPKTVQLRPIDKKTVSSSQGGFSEMVVPVPGRFTGPPKRRKIQIVMGKPSVRLNSYSGARLWDGKPKNQTSYA